MKDYQYDKKKVNYTQKVPFKKYAKDGGSVETLEFELNPDMTILELKQYLLRELKEPFAFKFFINNTDKLSDLIKLNNEWNNKHQKNEPLEVFMDRQTFSLWIQFGKSTYEISGLTE